MEDRHVHEPHPIITGVSQDETLRQLPHLAVEPNGLTLLQTLKRLTGPKRVREWLGLSLAQMGEALGAVHPNGHGGQSFNKGAVWAWENYPAQSRRRLKQFRMTGYTQEAYLILVREVIAQRTNGGVRVRARRGARVWKFEARATCVSCGKEFVMERSNAKRCSRCRR